MNLNTLFFILVFRVLTRTTLCDVNPNFQACEPKTCGNGPTITDPFHIQDKQDPFCGFPGFALVCASNGFPMLNLSNTLYIVHDIFEGNHSLRLSNPNLLISCLYPPNDLNLGNRYTLAPNQKEVKLFFDCDLASLREEMKKNVLGCFKGKGKGSVLVMAVDDKEEKLQDAMDNHWGGAMTTTVMENVEGGIREALGRGFLLKIVYWTASDECDACKSCWD